METLSREQIAAAFRALGLQAGDKVLTHSSLSSIGHVDGGAQTVVDAFLDVLGPAGTLIFPTYIFSKNKTPNPLFDPVNDPSEMGQISETARTRPGAVRSHHQSGSIGALGPHAQEIAGRQGHAGLAADGPFWKFYELDVKIMMLGVPYLRCTYFHFLEELLQVSYRKWREKDARIRYPDGSEGPLPSRSFSPQPGYPGNDYNKVGALMESLGAVRVGPVGNAVTRVFSAQAALEIGFEAYRKDHNLFLRDNGQNIQLKDGVMIGELNNEKTVYDPGRMYARPVREGRS